jgi:phage baseplate assembly protein W
MANKNTEDFFYGTDYFRSTLQEDTNKKKSVYGLNFPIGSGPANSGYFSKASGKKMILDGFKQLLLTERGERIMRPDFGLNLRRHLFNPLDEVIVNSIRREITDGITKYAKDISIKRLRVFQEGENQSTSGHGLRIQLVCAIKPTDELTEIEVTIV